MDSVIEANARVLEEQGFDPSRVHLNHFNGRLYSGFQGWCIHQLNNVIRVGECVARVFHALRVIFAYFPDYRFAPELNFPSKFDAVQLALRSHLVKGEASSSLRLSPRIVEYLQKKGATYDTREDLGILEDGMSKKDWKIEPTDCGNRLGKALHLAVLRNLPRLADHCISQNSPLEETMKLTIRRLTNEVAMEAFCIADQSEPSEDDGLLVSQRPIFTAVLKDNEAMVNRLLDAGAQVDVADAFGNTLLEYLVVSGMEELAIKAIDLGAPVDQLAGTERSIEERLPEQGMEDLRARIEEARGRHVKG